MFRKNLLCGGDLRCGKAKFSQFESRILNLYVSLLAK